MYGGYGSVAAPSAHIAVQGRQMNQPVAGHCDAGQRVVIPVGTCKGRSVYHAAQLRERNGRQSTSLEDMYV